MLDPIKFPGYCKLEVQWMFLHLNTDGDGQLSQKELSDLENDRIEKCIKPFIDRCDTDKYDEQIFYIFKKNRWNYEKAEQFDEFMILNPALVTGISLSARWNGATAFQNRM